MSENQSPTEYFRQRLRDRENIPQYALDEYKIDNLTSIEIKNFKSIKSEKLILRSATFIAGLNSAGKSSFTQALIVILQWINNLSDNKKSYIPLNGAIQQLGNNVYDILNRGTLSQINNEKSGDLATEITLNFKESFYGYGPRPISKDSNKISIKFTLEPTESISSSFLLSRVTFDVKVGTRKIFYKELSTEEVLEKITESWTYDFKSKFSIKDFINNEVINLYLEKVSLERIPTRRVKEEFEIYQEFQDFLLEVDDEFKYLYTLKIPTPSIRYKYSSLRENFTENYEHKTNKDGYSRTREVVDQDKRSESNSTSKTIFFPKEIGITDQSPLLESGLSNTTNFLNNHLRNRGAYDKEQVLKLFLFDRVCSNIHRFISYDFDDKFNIKKNRSLLLTNAFLEKKDENFKNTFDDFKRNSSFSIFINRMYVKYFESLPSEYSVQSLEDFKKDVFEYFKFTSSQDKTYLIYSNEEELKFFQVFSKFLICTNLGPRAKDFNFLSSRNTSSFRSRNILREFRVDSIKQFFNSLSLTKKEDLHRSYFESDAWSDELFDLITDNINLEEYFIQSLLGPKGPTSPRTYNRRSVIPELREDVMKFLTEDLSDDLLYHSDKKNKYNISELSTEMLSIFEKVFLTETKEICKKYNLFLDKSIVDNEVRKLEKFELFLSSVSEEIINKYYQNIEGEVQKVFAHWILTIALPFPTGDRVRSSWDYFSRCLSLFSLNDENNETPNILDLNNNVLLNEDKIISTINPQKKLMSSLSYEKFYFLNSTRQSQVTNYLVSEKLAPIGINGEFLSRFIFLYGKDKYNAPTPPSNSTKVPTNLKELYDSKSSLSLIDHLNSWLSYIFNLENVRVDYDEQNNQIKINQDSLSNVGSGLNQVLGILVLLIISSDDNSQTTIFLEEVEQNLHTSAQSKLADTLLIFSSHPTTRVVVETHSDHIVNRLRIKSIKGKEFFGTSDFNLYFATLDNDNGTKLNEMKINSKGEFDSSIIPPGFFDQYHKDTIQILEALIDKEKEE